MFKLWTYRGMIKMANPFRGISCKTIKEQRNYVQKIYSDFPTYDNAQLPDEVGGKLNEAKEIVLKYLHDLMKDKDWKR